MFLNLDFEFPNMALEDLLRRLYAAHAILLIT